MANKKIIDLPAGAAVLGTTLFEGSAAGLLSERFTGDQLRFYAAGFTDKDDFVYETFSDYAVGAISVFDKGSGWANNGVGTNASIISATGADGRTQNRLALNNGSYGRRMPWGAFWNRIKICTVWRINNGSTFLNTNGYVGICSGTTNMVDSATTTNFAGVRWGDGTGTSTFTAGTKISFFDVPTFRAATRRVNTTTDRGGLSSGHTVSADQGYLSTSIIELSRPVFANDASSVNYSIAEASGNQTSVQFSHSKNLALFMAGSDITAGNLANSNSDTAVSIVAGITAAPFAFDQSTGALDTINFYWPQAFNLEIAAFAIRKIQ